MSERKKFEAWAKEIFHGYPPLGRTGDGYWDVRVNAMWKAWSARSDATCAPVSAGDALTEHERGDLEKFKAHSVILNSVIWRMGEALGLVPEGEERLEVDIYDLIDRYFTVQQDGDAVAWQVSQDLKLDGNWGEWATICEEWYEDLAALIKDAPSARIAGGPEEPRIDSCGWPTRIRKLYGRPAPMAVNLWEQAVNQAKAECYKNEVHVMATLEWIERRVAALAAKDAARGS